jgi:hypothetical protein
MLDQALDHRPMGRMVDAHQISSNSREDAMKSDPEMAKVSDEFDNSFDMPLPPAEAWPILTDIRRIAPFVPGVELTEVVDDATYRGKISVRLGPAALAFTGMVTLEIQ